MTINDHSCSFDLKLETVTIAQIFPGWELLEAAPKLDSLGMGQNYIIYQPPKWILYPGWWFQTFFIFPYIGNNNPNWLIFFRGVGQPPTSTYVKFQAWHTLKYFFHGSLVTPSTATTDAGPIIQKGAESQDQDPHITVNS